MGKTCGMEESKIMNNWLGKTQEIKTFTGKFIDTPPSLLSQLYALEFSICDLQTCNQNDYGHFTSDEINYNLLKRDAMFLTAGYETRPATAVSSHSWKTLNADGCDVSILYLIYDCRGEQLGVLTMPPHHCLCGEFIDIYMWMHFCLTLVINIDLYWKEND